MTSAITKPIRTISASSCIRVCDLGGWTDTWFMERTGTAGRVVHVAVAPGAEVEITEFEHTSAALPCHFIKINLENFGEQYDCRLYPDPAFSFIDLSDWQAFSEKHALLAQCLTYFLAPNIDKAPKQDSFEFDDVEEVQFDASGKMLPPKEKEIAPASSDAEPEIVCRRISISLRSTVPSGASTGTSAAVLVALVACLDMLVHDGQQTLSKLEIAKLAHHVEYERAKRQCGVQDQIAAALGGINSIEIRQFPFVDTQVQSLHERLDPRALLELENRLVLVFLGNSHNSSSVHGMVIKHLEQDSEKRSILVELAKAAEQGMQALATTAASDATTESVAQIDFVALGQAMRRNTELQEQLHPELVSEEARLVIGLARKYPALGWKINGAGGSGGTLTILTNGDAQQKQQLIADIHLLDSSFKCIPVTLNSDGVSVQQTMH